MAWDDPAAVENAAIALVNDLDLVVLDPRGTRHYPWTLDPENPSAPATRDRPDRLNVIEQVLVDEEVVPGQWQIQVAGEGIRSGAVQRYALAFSPMGVPVAPALETVSRLVSDDWPGTGNANGVVDPGETISVELELEHLGGPPATNVTATLYSTTPGVTVVEPVARFPDLLVGDRVSNLSPLLVRLDKPRACGSLIDLMEVIEANGVAVSNSFQQVVGRLGVTNQTVSVLEQGGEPVVIPDRGTTVSRLSVPFGGRVTGVQVSVRIEHPWHGDLRLEIEHPDGTRVRLVEASGNSGADFGAGGCEDTGGRTVFSDAATQPIHGGGAPHVGVYLPVEPLARFVGKSTTGDWALWASDLAAEDEGTLLCWGLTLAYEDEGYICELFNQAPLVASDTLDVVFDSPRWLWLPGLDPDGDAIAFAITEMPQHGTISSLDPVTGWVAYNPAPGYAGADRFAFEVGDGYATSGPAEIKLNVLPPSVDLAVDLTSPEVAGLSRVVTQVVRVTNYGPNHSQDALLTCSLPADVSLVSVETDQGEWTRVGDLVIVELGELELWGMAEVRIHWNAATPGTITNLFEVLSVEADWDPSNNAVMGITEVMIDVDLAVGLELGQEEGLVGRELGYEVVVTNLGPHEARGVVLEMEWLGEVELVLVEASQGDWEETGGKVRCEIGEMGVGGEARVLAVVRGMEDGVLTNAVRVVSGELDLVPENNVVEGRVMVERLVGLGVRQELGVEEVLMGEVWRIGVVVTNVGPSEARGVRVEDELAAGMELVEVGVSQGEWVEVEGGLEWAVGVMGKGEGALMELWVRGMAEGWLTNVVRVSGEEAEGDGSDNETEAVVRVVAAADLRVGLGSWYGSVVGIGDGVEAGVGGEQPGSE